MEKIKLAVIGDPISHSKSPEIHNAWLNDSSIEGVYEAINVKKEDLRKFLENLSINGFRGINITVPHKEESFKIIREIGDIRGGAREIKAINTIKVEDGKLVGYNTDSKGFINSVYEKGNNFNFLNKNILIIGAGGAARAIISGLKEEKVENISIVNRTFRNALKLKEEFKLTGDVLTINEIESYLDKVDVVINTSSMGLNEENNLDINWPKLTKKIICIDIVYKPKMTKFLVDAYFNGHDVITGEGMLIHQAKIAFDIWFNGEKEKIK